MEKTWREAKPKWAVEQAEKEIAEIKRRAALRWPDEARPTPVPFSWEAYDRLNGEPVAGQYFRIDGYRGVSTVYIRNKRQAESGFTNWMFSESGEIWNNIVRRGPLYETEREANLAALWAACDEAAKYLEKAWEAVINDRGCW